MSAGEGTMLVLWVWAACMCTTYGLSLFEVYAPRPDDEDRPTIAGRIAKPFWAITARIYRHDETP